jgi:hypothetical protein
MPVRSCILQKLHATVFHAIISERYGQGISSARHAHIVHNHAHHAGSISQSLGIGDGNAHMLATAASRLLLGGKL